MKPCINEFAPLQSLRSGAAGADLSMRLEDGTHALRRAHPARMASTLEIFLRWEVAALTFAVFIGSVEGGAAFFFFFELDFVVYWQLSS